MITRSSPIENAKADLHGPKSNWENQYASGFRQPAELLAYLQLEQHQLVAHIDANNPFAMRVPLAFAQRMQPGNPADPLLLQVLPTQQENTVQIGFSADPLAENAARLGSGVIKKYQGRALIITTGACAVHCRYCFRRSFPYAAAALNNDQLLALYGELAAMPDLEEVILSGGDPLSLSDARLAVLLERLAQLKQLQRLRIHTRLPVVLPDRITTRLLDLLKNFPQPVVVVLHANHANELDASLAHVTSQLRAAGVMLLNQTVLLRGINDNIESLVALSQRSAAIGVLPYYLHQLDKVAGAAHFAVEDSVALALHSQLRQKLSGYLVPRLVREVPGAPAKELLF